MTDGRPQQRRHGGRAQSRYSQHFVVAGSKVDAIIKCRGSRRDRPGSTLLILARLSLLPARGQSPQFDELSEPDGLALNSAADPRPRMRTAMLPEHLTLIRHKECGLLRTLPCLDQLRCSSVIKRVVESQRYRRSPQQRGVEGRPRPTESQPTEVPKMFERDAPFGEAHALRKEHLLHPVIL